MLASACYNKQEVGAYLQPFLRYEESIAVKQRLLKIFLFDAFVWGELFTQLHEILGFLLQLTVKISWSESLIW